MLVAASINIDRLFAFVLQGRTLIRADEQASTEVEPYQT